MVGILGRVFQRYAAAHVNLTVPGFALVDEDGASLGYLDRVSVRDHRLIFEGWTPATQVTITLDGQTVSTRPDLIRVDAAAALGTDPDVPLGFYLSIPYRDAACTLAIVMAGRTSEFDVPVPNQASIARTGRALMGPFARDVLRAAPAVAKWYWTRDLRWRGEVRRALRLHDDILVRPSFEPALFDQPAALPEPDSEITIVLPVYNALDLLPEVLDRVCQHTDVPWRLVVIEDCSTDQRVRPFLQSWHTGLTPDVQARVQILQNAENLGFIQSVNRGFEAAAGRAGHVVLLNSDAFVPERWASRLLAPIRNDPSVASVTPMFNDAEIGNVPSICVRSDLEPGEADRIDAIARQLNPDIGMASAPTGVGFCMALNRRFPDHLPAFDVAFGKGYGEEVDWCQRASARGGQHVILGNLFVEHRGGASFGSVEKQKLIQGNNARIVRRYPNYDLDVQNFIRADPLASVRLYLGLVWADLRQDAPLPVYIAHAMGGGAEMYLERRIAADLGAGKSLVVLRVGGASLWDVELHTAHGVTCSRTDDQDLLHRILKPLRKRHIVYSNAVGHRDLLGLPDFIRTLKQSDDDRIDILLHDFLVLSPSYTLLDSTGHFAGVPTDDDADPAHRWAQGGSIVPLSEWRARWRDCLEDVDEVVAFDDNSAALFAAAYPESAARCVVKPHVPDLTGFNLTPAPKVHRSPVIGVLGNVGYQKGAAVLQAMARALPSDWGLVVIGMVDPAYPLAAPAVVHGRYQLSDVTGLVARYGISHWVIPSIWPETFSFATHEALATGLPVYCFDLGAQADAVRAEPNGTVLPRDGDAAMLAQRVIDRVNQDHAISYSGGPDDSAPKRPDRSTSWSG